MNLILDTPEAIEAYRIAVIKTGLKLEIKTGLRHSRNAVFNAAKKLTGKKTRLACLAVLEARYPSP